MDQTPQSSTLHRLRNVLEMSNRTTPAESQSKQSETEWKTPNKGGYPEHSPRSNAMKWLKSEEAFLTHLSKFHLNQRKSRQNLKTTLLSIPNVENAKHSDEFLLKY